MGLLNFISGCTCNATRRTSQVNNNREIVLENTKVITPDLSIYSQSEILSKNQIPSWNSPDIITNSLKPFRLNPEAEVTIRNISQEVPAINALVHFFVSPFGIGTKRELKLSKLVNLGINQELKLNFPFDTQTLQGDSRVGVNIQIEHSTDRNKINNVGSQVIDSGFTSSSDRDFTINFPVYNDSEYEREIRLEIMKTDLKVMISPNTYRLSPREQIIATARIEVPDYLRGTTTNPIKKEVTIVGRTSEGFLVGGLTRLVRIDN